MKPPPGPKPWNPFANMRAMQRDSVAFLSRVAAEYGDASSFRFGPQRVYFFNHPDLIRDVLVTHNKSFQKGRALQQAKIALGEGLLTSEGEFHKRQRRLAQPAFHRDRINRYGEVMVEHALRTRERWRDGEEFDAHHEMMRLTLSVVAKTLFDADVNKEAEDIGRALTELMELFPLLFNPLAILLRAIPFVSIRRHVKSIGRLDAVIYRIIEERRASAEDRGDLLSMLLLAQDEEGDGGGMTDQQLRDEVLTLFLAGHETTANALSWTLYLLAQHPEVERELHRELDEILGDRAPAPADYPRLPYTEMVLAESMRLFPPAWAVGRLALEDVDIGEWRVPRGALVLVSQWTTHRDARFWPDPEHFDPMRFTADAKASRPKLAYFPFGAGARICIGESFAWMEGVLILAVLAQRWRFELVNREPVKPLPLITLRPKGGIAMRAVSL
ncbi:MAG TPA: cytochrome P450 [Thermoanaerobaculia bacterium]|nr:cytochrome P450 [Thermoanaerobaculia bacterium]